MEKDVIEGKNRRKVGDLRNSNSTKTVSSDLPYNFNENELDYGTDGAIVKQDFSQIELYDRLSQEAERGEKDYSFIDELDYEKVYELVENGYLEYFSDDTKVEMEFEELGKERYNPDEVLEDLREGIELLYSTFEERELAFEDSRKRMYYNPRKIISRDEPYLPDGIIAATDSSSFVIFNPRHNYIIRVKIATPHEAAHTQGYSEGLIDSSLKA